MPETKTSRLTSHEAILIPNYKFIICLSRGESHFYSFHHCYWEYWFSSDHKSSAPFDCLGTLLAIDNMLWILIMGFGVFQSLIGRIFLARVLGQWHLVAWELLVAIDFCNDNSRLEILQQLGNHNVNIKWSLYWLDSHFCLLPHGLLLAVGKSCLLTCIRS